MATYHLYTHDSTAIPSLKWQQAQIEGWKEQHPDAPVSEVTDRDKGPVLARATIQAMLERLRRGDVLIVPSFACIGRNIAEAANLLSALGERGVRLQCLSSTAEEARRLDSIRGAVEHWRTNRSRTGAAIAAAHSVHARSVGDLRYGYRIDPQDSGQMIEHPDEGPVLRMMWAMHQEGMTYRGIANYLNSNGVPARGKKWHKTSIHRILRDHEEDLTEDEHASQRTITTDAEGAGDTGDTTDADGSGSEGASGGAV